MLLFAPFRGRMVVFDNGFSIDIQSHQKKEFGREE